MEDRLKLCLQSLKKKAKKGREGGGEGGGEGSILNIKEGRSC